MSKPGRPNRKGVINYHGTKGIISALTLPQGSLVMLLLIQ